MSSYRWSVRNLDEDILELLREVKEVSGLSYGEIVSEAVSDWYRRLPEDDAETVADGTSLAA